MKKFLLIVLTLLILCVLLTGCRSEEIEITFDTDGGTAIPKMTVGEEFVMPTNPTKAYHTFVGWFTDAQKSVQFDGDKPSENITLYALWSKNPPCQQDEHNYVEGVCSVCGQNEPLPPDIVIDDFDYADTPSLIEVWVADNGSTVTNTDEGMHIFAPSSGGQAQRNLSADYAKYKSFEMTFKTGENGDLVTVSFGCRGGYSYSQFRGNGQWQTVKFTFSSLIDVKNYDGIIGLLIVKLEDAQSSVTVSNIKFLATEQTQQVKEDIKDKLLCDFEGLEVGEIITSVKNGYWAMDGGTAGLITAEEGLNGYCLNAPKTVTGVIMVLNGHDWSVFKGMQFSAQTTQGITAVFVQVKDSSETYAQAMVSFSPVERTIKLNFDQFYSKTGNVNFSSLVFLKFYIVSNEDKGDIMIDDILLSVNGYDIDNSVMVYDDFSYSSTEELRKVWTTGTFVNYLGKNAMLLDGGTAVTLNRTSAQLTNFNTIRITYWTLSSYNMLISMWVQGYDDNGGNFNGQMKLEAASDDNYKVATIKVPGGVGRIPWNVQLKNIATDCYVAKIEFIYDDSAPQLEYSYTRDVITIERVSDCEYSIDGGDSWFDNNVFEDVSVGGQYVVAIRYKEANGFPASKIQSEQVTLSRIILPTLFRDNCVLQRGKQITLTGEGDANTEYTLTFNGQTKQCTSDDKGQFLFVLDEMSETDEGQSLVITDGVNSLSVSNVLVGEVWIVAGQSNIQMKLATSDFTQQDANLSLSGKIRLFNQNMATSKTVKSDVSGGGWVVADFYEAADFSALGYMFGANLYDLIDVPVGIIYAAQGDTPIEAWISANNYSGKNTHKNENFNAMVAPLTSYSVNGVIWYQGENNSAKANKYSALLQSLIADWREAFSDSQLYFEIIQLPRYDSGSVNWALLREAQEDAVSKTEFCDLIVTIDDGDLENIHPSAKRYIALRCVAMAAYRLYGKEAFNFPNFADVTVNGDTLTVTVENALSLHASDGQALRGFEICGADYEFFPANAVIEGNTIKLSSVDVSSPLHVRYNFTSVAGGNVVNEKNLPLAPFRTDDYNIAYTNDFEKYDHTDALINELLVTNAEVSLVNGDSGKAMEVTALMPEGSQAAFKLGGDWAGYKSIKLRFRTAENFKTFSIVLNTDGSHYPFFSITGNGQWQTAVIPFSMFSGIDGWDGSVTYLIFKLKGVYNSVIIDDVEILSFEEYVNPGPTYVDTVFEDFANYISTEQLMSKWKNDKTSTILKDGALTTTGISDNAQVFLQISTDWTGYDKLRLTYMTQNDGDTFSFTINCGGKYSFFTFMGNGTLQTVTVSFEDLNLADQYTGLITYIMIKPGVDKTVSISKIELLAD